MEKNPEELGKIFELVVDRSEKLLTNIVPLEADLKAIYEANTIAIKESVDDEILIQHLDKIRVPAIFLKSKDIMFQQLSEEVSSLQTRKDELVKKSSVELPKRTKKIFALMDFLPKKIGPMGDRYEILCELLSADGVVDKVFESLEKLNNSRKVRMFSKEKWRKSLYLTRQFAEEISGIIDHLYRAYYTNDEIAFNQHLTAFDIKIRQLNRFEDVEEFFESMEEVEEIPDDEELAALYKSISLAQRSVDKVMVSISSQKHVDRLIGNLKDEMVKISNERKAISLKVMNINKPLEVTKEILNSGEYLQDVFWKVALLDYDSFGAKLKRILKTGEFDDWNDARKRYALIYKIKFSISTFNGVFGVLTDSFDQALTNYRKAKRNYHRHEDASSQRGFEAATMHPVEISETANICLGQFVTICDNLKDMNVYITDTNKFYKENLKVATELYTNIRVGLKEWGNVFKLMYRQ